MYLLHPDTLIFSQKGHKGVPENLVCHRLDSLEMSVASVMELYYGAYNSEKVALNWRSASAGISLLRFAYRLYHLYRIFSIK